MLQLKGTVPKNLNAHKQYHVQINYMYSVIHPTNFNYNRKAPDPFYEYKCPNHEGAFYTNLDIYRHLKDQNNNATIHT